ncbi:MAG: cysteine desulfurase [Bacilli bacterium]|nr:cysteine desulfurase [Bacilli bacterium]
MVYLDYSATTPTSDEVLDTFVKVSKRFVGNPNSLHKLGVESRELIDASTKQIAEILKVDPKEIIYTSGASESNNMAIKGICLQYQNRGKHIITTNFEHSSVYGPISYLQSIGFEVDFVKTDEFGIVDLDDLKKLLRDDTILVSITAVNSEIGIIEPIEEIGKILKEYPKCFFHCDVTQIIGKKEINLENIDLASFSAHKIFGIKGIGCLIKKEKISITPLIHGGKSTTIYRSGTPQVALIASLAKTLRLANEDLEANYLYVSKLNSKIKNELSKYQNVHINSNDKCLPYILNLSIPGIKPETMLHALEEKDIYISTQTACASNDSYSKAVYSLTNDKDLASSSIRISISYITTLEEIDIFIKEFIDCVNKLTLRGE